VTKASEPFTCFAILFDLDGVLVDSRRCVEFVWQTWFAEQGRDPREFIAVAHGRRTSATRGVTPVPGAADLLTSLPRDRWAVVTSGSPAVARLRLRVAAVPTPAVLITGADVRRGKPDPDGYLQAAERLGFAPAECLVVEDAPAGVAAGRAAGMRVVAVAGTVPAEELRLADHHIAALTHLQVSALENGQFRVVLRDS
jgi:sugar-phosphatase